MERLSQEYLSQISDQDERKLDFGNAFRQFAEHVSPVQASMRKRMLAVSLGIMRDDFSIPFELKKSPVKKSSPRRRTARPPRSEPVLQAQRPQAARFQLQAIDVLVHGQLHKGERIQAPRDPDPDAGTQISKHRTAVRTIRLRTACRVILTPMPGLR